MAKEIVNFDPNWLILDCNSSLNSLCIQHDLPMYMLHPTKSVKCFGFFSSWLSFVFVIWINYIGFLLLTCSQHAGLPHKHLVHDCSSAIEISRMSWVNSLRPRQNKRHIADDVFKCNFWNENVRISITISLKFVPKGPFNIFPALVQIMAWRRTGEKPLSEPKMTQFNNTYMFASLLLIKSPQYTGGDFMFLYRFVRRRRRLRRRPPILVHAITFEQLFGFLSFLAQLLALTCILPD